MDKVKIKITIADREYPMTVSPEEEVFLRKAGKKINKIVDDFTDKYSIKDKQDALAMCALQYVAKDFGNQQIQLKNTQNIQEELGGILSKIRQQK